MTAPESARTPITAVDGVGLGAGAVAIVLTAVLGWGVAPRFGRMFADFGGALPAFTRLWFNPWPILVVAALPLVVVAHGIFRRASDSSRTLRMLLAIGAIFVLVPAFLVAMYLPIFSLAKNVQ